ncbi:hypothetical protein B0J14DRAFT_114437 [Halenospora varia]|nr:hypothetical protein B0J14DRAFT_114437 [Halenospora varia]
MQFYVQSSIVLEHIKSKASSNRKVGLAFVYFKYDSPEHQQTEKVLALFIKQLCYGLVNIPGHLLKFYEKFYYSSRSPIEDQYLSELQLLITKYQEVFIIIDALDEFDSRNRDSENRKSFIKILQDLTHSCSCVKIFITSRRETDIETALSISPTPVIQIAARDVGKDIETFVKGRIEEWIRAPKPYLPSKDLRERIFTRLIKQANGMFLWVDLQFEMLRQQRRDRDLEEQLEKLPQGLDETYQRILYHINQQESRLQLLAKNILTWVFYTKRPLSMDELVHAVALDDNCNSRQELQRNSYTKETILEVCANLIIDESSAVRPIHFSVQEYFTKPRNYDDNNMLSCLANHDIAYAHLARCCIHYIMLVTLAGEPSQDEEELAECIEKYPLSSHSAYRFDYYVVQLEALPSNLKKSLNKLLFSRERSLASILQLRKLRDNTDWENVISSFSDFQDAVLPEDIIYATALYNSPQLQCLDDRWKAIQAPRYALHRAAGSGLLDALTPLIKLGQPVSGKDDHGITPLYYASEAGYEAVCRLLVECGGGVNAQGGFYGNALQAASFGGHQAMVELLLTKGADVNAQGGYYGNALQAASLQGHQAVVELLLTKGADVNAQGGFYGNALQAASEGGHQAVVELLLTKGADVNAQGGHYGNALQVASLQGHQAMVEMLLAKGADSFDLSS